MKITHCLILFAFAALLLSSCSKDEEPAAPAAPIVVAVPEIGKVYGGGIVFYIDSTGNHGLAAATGDLKFSAAWGCEGALIGANGSLQGTGNQNTTAIVGGCISTDIAARQCSTLSSGGYSTGWYMPSKDELNLMYNVLYLHSYGGFTGSYYWSSTEEDPNKAWFQFFGNGVQERNSKAASFYVRAIRAF